jgi:hypothetical protein
VIWSCLREKFVKPFSSFGGEGNKVGDCLPKKTTPAGSKGQVKPLSMMTPAVSKPDWQIYHDTHVQGLEQQL